MKEWQGLGVGKVKNASSPILALSCTLLSFIKAIIVAHDQNQIIGVNVKTMTKKLTIFQCH